MAVPKQVSIVVSFLVVRGCIFSWPPLCSMGNTWAEGCWTPSGRTRPSGSVRIRAATQTRLCCPSRSWPVVWAVQIARHPSTATRGGGRPGRGISGSRTGSGTCSAALFFGSTTEK